MKRRRALQLILFLKVSLIIGLVAGCGVASRIWKVPFLWAVFCTGHSLQVNKLFRRYAWKIYGDPFVINRTFRIRLEKKHSTFEMKEKLMANEFLLVDWYDKVFLHITRECSMFFN